MEDTDRAGVLIAGLRSALVKGIVSMKRRSPTWFFFALLTGVFAMSLLAPLAWNRRQAPVQTRVDSCATMEGAVLAPSAPIPIEPSADLEGPPTAVVAQEVLHRLPPIEPVLGDPAPQIADFVRADLDAATVPVLQPTAASHALTLSDNHNAESKNQAAPTPPVAGWLPMPQSLLAQLDAVAKLPQAADWAKKVRAEVQAVAECHADERARIETLLVSLAKQVNAADSVVESIPSEERQSDIRRAANALARRLILWEGACKLTGSGAAPLPSDAQQAEAEEARRRARRVANFLPWNDGRHYERTRTETPPAGPKPAASQAVALPSATSLSGRNDEILQLLALIECYEQSRTASDARVATSALHSLAASRDAAVGRWATRIAETYRSPNVRFALTEKFADRLLPQPDPMESEVDDWIQGARVFGQNTIFTNLKAHLVPDPHRFHLLLVADGVVDSQTSAHSGPAVFENEGRTFWEAYQAFIISPTGLTRKAVVSEANAENEVVRVSTDYDRWLIFGPIARSIALKKQGQQESAALMEVEEKVADAARDRLKVQLDPRVEQGVAMFQQKLWQPLKRLDLDPHPVEMFTTRDRMVTRILVGDEGQLAAHTPRPRAPSDSLASMQMHETLLNNAVEQLKLDGQSMSLPELYRRVSKELNGEAQTPPDTLPGNVHIRFAAKDAVRVRFTDGHVELTLSLDEVRKGQDRWQNLMVRAYYAPEGTGLDARLVRTDTIELKGEELSAGSQIALRGAFAKLLSRSRTVALVPQKLVDDRRLQDLEITQFEIRDGWIGVAIGPGNVPGRAAKRVKVETQANSAR